MTTSEQEEQIDVMRVAIRLLGYTTREWHIGQEWSVYAGFPDRMPFYLAHGSGRTRYEALRHCLADLEAKHAQRG